MNPSLVGRGKHRLRNALVVVCAALCMAACDNLVDPPEDAGPYLYGRVTDSSGAPIAGAPVSLVYRLDGYELDNDCDPIGKPIVAAVSDLQPGFVQLLVLDYMGRRVRTLMDSENPPVNPGPSWNGEDDHGRPVPTGMYIMQLNQVTEWGPERHAAKLFVYYCSRAQNFAAPQATTDRNGEYRIPTRLLPIGETFPYHGDTGDPAGQITIAEELYVQSAVGAGVSARSVVRTIRVTDRFQNRQVDLVIP